MTKNSNEKIELNLNGFSGNSIQVIRSARDIFVRKTAKNISENEKMQKEIQKLETLQEIADKTNEFKIPKIKSMKHNDNGLFSYELEFVVGENFDSFLNKLNSNEIQNFAKKIFSITQIISNRSIQNKINEKDFLLYKLFELKTKLNNKMIANNFTKELLKEYENKLDNLVIDNKYLSNQGSFCHGDLALDNIMITRHKEIYLIDPLYNDFESNMWDISKVLQSSFTYWNLIKQNEFQIYSNSRKIQLRSNEHIAIFHNHFIKNLKDHDSSQILLYLAVTLARVAKYAKSEKQLCALLIIINDLLTEYSNDRKDLDGALNSLRW